MQNLRGQTRCIIGDVQMANRPLYRYGGHIWLIGFKEYYGMPRGHEFDPFGIYARFSENIPNVFLEYVCNGKKDLGLIIVAAFPKK